MSSNSPAGPRRARVAGWLAANWRWLPLFAIVAALAMLLGQRETTAFDAPLLVAGLRLVLLAAVPALAAALAVRVYLRTGVAAFLALGAAMLATALGAGGLAAAVQFPVGIVATVATNNVSALLAAFLIFASAVQGVLGTVVGTDHRGRHVLLAYGGVSLAIALWAGLLAAGMTPVFWGPEGTTAVRLFVLGAAAVLYALSAFAWWQLSVRERGIGFLHWYVPGLALFAVAMIAFVAQTQLGGAVNWLGRAAQYLGAAYLFMAAATQTRLLQRGDPAVAARDAALGMSLLQAALPLRPLVESTPDAVVGINRRGRIAYWNRAARQLFGLEAAAAFDADPVRLLAGDDVDDPTAGLLRALLSDPSTAVAEGRRELTLRRGNGAPFPAEVAVFADPDDPRLVVLVITDVSRRVQSRDELERRVLARTAELEALNLELARANAAKDEFLGLVSHELKTPITSILAVAAILRQRVIRPNRPFVADLVGEAQRLTGIVDNLLALARLDAGRETPREPVALDRLADDVIRAVEREEPAREIRQTSETDVVVEGNADQLGMVLRNYLSNALKYSPADQAIDVRVGRRDDLARVEVLDRGFGLSPDELPGLFQPFIRGARARGTAGVGVGLAVCRRIMEAHDGEVGARARTDGPGSAFWFELPLAAHDGADAADEHLGTTDRWSTGGGV